MCFFDVYFWYEALAITQKKIQKENPHHKSGSHNKRNDSSEKNIGWMIFHYFFPFLTNCLKLSPLTFQVKFSRTDESTTSDGG